MSVIEGLGIGENPISPHHGSHILSPNKFSVEQIKINTTINFIIKLAMKSINKSLNRILFLYPCYQYFFYEKLYNFKSLNYFFEQIIGIPNTEIFIKFHPRHYN